MRLNNNIAALSTYTSLLNVNRKIDNTMEKLSSGYKINSVSDDAAGLAISNKMRNQIKGLERASRNSLDGVSLIQTAEGALNEMHDILQRMRELCVQAASGTEETADRQKIQAEIAELKDTINAISSDTEYNKITLFNGSADLMTRSDDAVVLKATDTLAYGDYLYRVTGEASKASYTIFEPSAPFTLPDESIAGQLKIGDDTIEITDKDTAESIFTKIRDVAEVYGFVAEKGGDSVLGKLESKYYGSKYGLEVSSDNEALLDALGLRGTEYNEGVDATVILIKNTDNSKSIISGTATHSVDGNRITISDNNNQKMIIEIPVESLERTNYFEETMNLIYSELYLIESAYTSIEELTSQIAALDMTATEEEIENMANQLFVLSTDAYNAGQEAKQLIVDAINKYPDLDLQNMSELQPYLDLINLHDGHITPSILNSVDVGVQQALNLASAGDIAGAISALSTAADTSLGDEETIGIAACSKTIAESAYEISNIISAQIFDPISKVSVYDYGLTFQVGPNKDMEMNIRIPIINTKSLEIDRLDASTIKSSSDSLDMCDNAIAYLSEVRAKLGAYQNRLEHTIASVDNTSENTTIALSRVVDADVAWEMTILTQSNVIAQAAMSIMAQANQRPQMLLQIMGG